jgi:hypothetical protein
MNTVVIKVFAYHNCATPAVNNNMPEEFARDENIGFPFPVEKIIEDSKRYA